MRTEVRKLIREMQYSSRPETKRWFENYLKKAIRYRGLKTPDVARIVKAWSKDLGINKLPEEEQIQICSDLLSSRYAEDKFAGTIYIQNYLQQTSPLKIVMLAEHHFEQGDFFDWSSTDWFCMRVLCPLVTRNGMTTAQKIASWRTAENLWQRRASIVSFMEVSKDKDYHPLIERVVAKLVVEDERFIQTGIGWLLATMSKGQPRSAQCLFEKHLSELSREVVDRHSKHLGNHRELKKRKRELMLSPNS